MTIIGANADVYPYHYKFRSEMNRRDGSTFKRSKPLPNYSLRAVLVVAAVIIAIVCVVWR